jgi:hypothetical protein
VAIAQLLEGLKRGDRYYINEVEKLLVICKRFLTSILQKHINFGDYPYAALNVYISILQIALPTLFYALPCLKFICDRIYASTSRCVILDFS